MNGLRRRMARAGACLALPVVVAACTSHRTTQQTECSAQPTRMYVSIDVTALEAHFPLSVRACTPGLDCRTERVPGSAAAGFADLPYADTSDSALIHVSMRLTIATHDGAIHRTQSLTIPVHQDVSAECGNYGGVGHVAVDEQGRMTAEPAST